MQDAPETDNPNYSGILEALPEERKHRAHSNLLGVHTTTVCARGYGRNDASTAEIFPVPSLPPIVRILPGCE